MRARATTFHLFLMLAPCALAPSSASAAPLDMPAPTRPPPLAPRQISLRLTRATPLDVEGVGRLEGVGAVADVQWLLPAEGAVPLAGAGVAVGLLTEQKNADASGGSMVPIEAYFEAGPPVRDVSPRLRVGYGAVVLPSGAPHLSHALILGGGVRLGTFRPQWNGVDLRIALALGEAQGIWFGAGPSFGH